MRRGTIVAGLTVGIIGVGGIATASAADIAITFSQGSEKLGSYPEAAVPSGAAFRGTIDLTSPTLAGAFPAAGNLLPEAVLPDVTIGTFANYRLAINAVPGDFTGSLNVLSASYDLRGPVTYRFVATKGSSSFSCTAVMASNLTLAGTSLDLGSGAYAVAGSVPTPAVAADDAASAPFCLAFTLNPTALPAASTVASAFNGKVTIPGLIPAPTGVPVITAPAPSTPSAPTPATPAPAVKAGRLSVSVSKPKTVRRGKSTVTKVVVRNTGAGSAKSVTVKLAAAGKGVTPRSTSKTYSSIAAGRSRTFSVRLKTKRTSSRSSAVKVTAKGASGLSASKSTTLRLR